MCHYGRTGTYVDMEEKSNPEIRRLVLAKMLYLHGRTHASGKDSVSRMLAIHHVDNAVEMVLRCVATRRGTTPRKKQLYFEQLLQSRDLPLKEQMRGLHRLRNAVQHQADVPSVESVIKYTSYAEDFFREVCRDIFSVPYEELFLSELIENENLRKQVLKAEEAFGKQKHGLCMKLCDDALIMAMFDEADIFQTAGMLTAYWGASEELRMVLNRDYLEKYRQEDYYELARELRGAILQWGQASTAMQFLDQYRMDFLKHRRIVETLEHLSDEELEDSAEFSLNFVTSLILKWQEEGVLD